MICNKCGQENGSNTNFCIKCGNPLMNTPSTVENNNMNANITTGKVVNSNIGLNQEQVISNNTNNSDLNYFKFMIETILKPIKTYKKEHEQLQVPKNAIILSVITSVLIMVLNLIKTVINTVYQKSYFTDKVEIDFTRLKYIEWTDVTLKTFIFIIIAIFAIAGIYYIGNLIAKKKANYMKLVGITSTSMIPAIICGSLLGPILSLIYSPLGTLTGIAGLIYSILIFTKEVNEEVNFEEKDYEIYYHTACFLSVILIAYIVIALILKDAISLYSMLG